MAIKLPSHLHRSRSGTLHFRITIPPDLRSVFGTKEIYRSLRTANVRDALYVSQAFSLTFQSLFKEIRKQVMGKAKDLAQDEDEGGFVLDAESKRMGLPPASRTHR